MIRFGSGRVVVVPCSPWLARHSVLKPTNQTLDLLRTDVGSGAPERPLSSECGARRPQPRFCGLAVAIEELHRQLHDPREAKHAIRLVWIETPLVLAARQGANRDARDVRRFGSIKPRGANQLVEGGNRQSALDLPGHLQRRLDGLGRKCASGYIAPSRLPRGEFGAPRHLSVMLGHLAIAGGADGGGCESFARPRPPRDSENARRPRAALKASAMGSHPRPP